MGNKMERFLGIVLVPIYMLIFMSIIQINPITTKAAEIKTAYFNVGKGSGDYINFNLDMTPYKAGKIIGLYIKKDGKKIALTSGINPYVIENGVIKNVTGKLYKDNFNVKLTDVVLPEMLPQDDPRREYFNIPTYKEKTAANDYKEGIYGFGDKYKSYRQTIDYLFPRNENWLTWSQGSDYSWRWMTNNDYKPDYRNGIYEGGITLTYYLQNGMLWKKDFNTKEESTVDIGSQIEFNDYVVDLSELVPLTQTAVDKETGTTFAARPRADMIYQYIHGNYRYQTQNAAFVNPETWTKHPPFEDVKSGVKNPYTAVGPFLAFYNYGFTVHLHAPGKANLDNVIEVDFEGETGGTPPPQPANTPPRTEITAPETVLVGQEFTLKGYGYDLEDAPDQLQYIWQTPAAVGTMDGQNGKIWYPARGKWDVTLTVIDTGGLSDTVTKTIEAIYPMPAVIIEKSGTFKENRKITLDASKSFPGSFYSGFDWSKAKWEVTPVTEGILQDNIKIVESLTGSKALNLICKKPGKYKAKCSLTNTYGMQGEMEIVFDVVPDLAPIVDFTFQNTILRDPLKNNYGTFTLTDASRTVDGDIIAKRIWLYSFDSNNDGNFDDEPWYVYDNEKWMPYGNYTAVKYMDVFKINDGNLKSVNLSVNHVGKYMFELIVVEEFGQETISQFINNSDKMKGNTFEN